ncbi:MAG: EamA family transporter, partial [Propionibacterium sp.]|nr:EamA family transporter [Propionibacterium sp.]
MTDNDTATHQTTEPLPKSHAGLWWGLLGVTAFSFTVPFTRVAVENGHMSALFVGSGRAVIAAVLAALALGVTRQKLPRGKQWLQVAVVAGGAVVGFPLLTSFALTTAPASHGAV